MSEDEQEATLVGGPHVGAGKRTTTVSTIEEESGEGIDKTKIRYQPPTAEPIRSKIRLTSDTEVYITGNYSDLIDILSKYALVARDYVRQDTTFDVNDIHGNDIVIAARAGRLNDLAVLYGMVYKQGVAVAVEAVRFYIRDGANINVSVVGQEVFVEYGNQKDLHTRFAFDPTTASWKRSPGNNRNGTGYPLATDPVASTRLP